MICAAVLSSLSPLVAAGTGLMVAIHFAVNNFLNCSIEVDSLQLIQLCLGCLHDVPWELEAIIQDIKALLSSSSQLLLNIFQYSKDGK